jgi:hypothetical protein
MSYILQNRTNAVVSFSLKPTFNPEGMPNWRVKKFARSETLWVKIAPNARVDLCEPPWNLTEKNAEEQVEVKTMLNRGYVIRVVDEKFVEPKPLVTIEEVLESLEPKKSPQAPEATQVSSVAEDIVSTANETGEVPGDIDLTKDPDSTNNLPEIRVEGEEASIMVPLTGKHAIPALNALLQSQPEGDMTNPLQCECGFVGKNDRSLKMHQKSCKARLQSENGN